MTDIWTKRILIMFGGICGGAYLIVFAGMMIPYSFSFPAGVVGFFVSAGFSVFVSFVIISPNKQEYLRKLKTKRSLGILSAILVAVSFAGMYASLGINPILHAMYSEEYMQETAYKSEIVQAYREMYPASSVRFVDYQAAPPAMVLEMEQNSRIARLMIGGFEKENLGYGFSCVTTGFHEDSVFYVNVKSVNDITENACFVKNANGAN